MLNMENIFYSRCNLRRISVPIAFGRINGQWAMGNRRWTIGNGNRQIYFELDAMHIGMPMNARLTGRAGIVTQR